MNSAGFGLRRRPSPSAREASSLCTTSPYSVHFKTPLSSEQRALIAHRTHVAKWPRADLEDKYLRLLDEHYALKKENHTNHDKIRKLVTRILRLTGQNFVMKRLPSSEVAFDDEVTMEGLQLRVIDLESYNAQLRERLRTSIEQQNRSSSGLGVSMSHRSRCVSASSTIRSASSGRASSMQLQKVKSRNCVYKRQPEEYLIDTMVTADNTKTSDEQTDVQIVNEQEVTEFKVIIERLHEELTMHCVDTQACSVCNDCVELETVRHQVERLQSEQKRLNEDHDRKLAEQNGHFENLLQTHRKKINELNDRLDQEMSANKTLTAAKEDLEQLLRAAQQNNFDCADISAENASLKKHRENIATLANELAGRTSNLREMRQENVALRTELGDVRHHVDTLELSYEDRMHKMRALQDSHDALAVQLEGVRAQCECLETFNRTLELENRRLHGL